MHQTETLHLPYDVIAERLRALPKPPTDQGAITLIVARPDVEERRLPDRCPLTPEGGVEDDRWAQRPNPNPEAQITVMRADVADVIGNGQPLELFGDNLLTDLDLSASNLPAGTRLRVGTALCEVTPKPHTGCGKYAARFGADARALLAAPEFVDARLRGLYFRVIEAGEVSPGDAIQVLSRPNG